jgi:acyl-CoA synthetase (AMP-forming)/AMP-acid ligase II
MNLAEWLVRTARRLPNAPALLSGKNVITDYAEFGRRVAVLASALQARLGIGRGDRVAIVMPNSVEYLELLYATWFAGAVISSCMRRKRPGLSRTPKPRQFSFPNRLRPI